MNKQIKLKLSVLICLIFLSGSIFVQIGDSKSVFSLQPSDTPPPQSPKPIFVAICPSGVIKAGDGATVSAETSSKLDDMTTYSWTVSSGEIVAGQGTPVVSIKTKENVEETVIVSVEIGVGSAEKITESCAFPTFVPPSARRVDEFDFSVQGELKARLDAFFVELANNPVDQGYVFIFPQSAAGQARVERVIKDFIKWRNYDPSRVTIAIGEKSSRTFLQFWLVPPGADAPKPELEAKYRLPVPLNVVRANASACELNGWNLHNLQKELSDNLKSSIKIVFSPGRAETAAVNLKRQKIFMDKIKNRFPSAQAITGAKTEGEGEVAIFIQEPGREEQLYLLIYAIKNKSVCLDCCESADAPKDLVGQSTRKRRR